MRTSAVLTQSLKRLDLVRRARANGPYSLAVLGLLLLFVVQYSDPSWVTGLTANYLPVHVVLEFIGILVSFAIFTVGWATYQNARDSDILILSVASFAVGALDLGHTLSFTGMPDFVGPSGPNKAIGFWFASRIIGSLALLYVALSRPRVNRTTALQYRLLAAAVAWVALCFWMILFRPDRLPVFFIPGEGLQPIKIIVEWILVGIATVAGGIFFVSAERRENMNIKWMGAAAFLYGVCGYFFTLYRDFDDVYNFVGHCYKAVCYILLYRAVFVECVSKPYARVQQMALEAETSNLSKSRFLANVSHEFRTPLGIIGGFSDLLINTEKLESLQRGWAETIGRNARQLSLLIDDLLDLAKAENEMIEIRHSRFDLALVANQIRATFANQVKEGVIVVLEKDLGGQDWVTTDELRLRQILINILGNAVKFTLEGEIRIVLHRLNPSTVEISILDTGIGIHSKEVARLFQPFSQVSNPNNRRFGGTGLGLSLSRKLAELIGGNLKLDHSHPGVGSSFTLRFTDATPPDAAPNPTAPKESAAPSAPALGDRRILIAEDSEDNQELLRFYLEPTKAELVFAENGREALAHIQTSHFDVVLMDIQMPEMDGFEATLEIRRGGWSGPIIALTAHALQPERERAMANGFSDYLVKPLKKESLWAAMSRTLA